MTVVEIDSLALSPHLDALTTTSVTLREEAPFLYSSNCIALERDGKSLEALQKARHLLDQMGQSLNLEDVETFNFSKIQLLRLFQQCKAPITAWNPLVLVFRDSSCLRGKNLAQIDLERVSLSGEEGPLCLENVSLQAARCQESVLTRVRLSDSDLSGADFRSADLREADLTRVLLIEADLRQAKLSFADFSEANLYGARLSGSLARQANFRKANFRKADLRYADLYQADLTEARLQHTDLREASLFLANLTQARLRQSDLRKANLGFSNLTQARLQEAVLQGASFASADLSSADLRGCVLKSASLNRARLLNTQLNGVKLYGLDLSLCHDLHASCLQDARFDNETRFPAGFNPHEYALRGLQCRGSHRLLHSLLTFLPHRCVEA